MGKKRSKMFSDKIEEDMIAVISKSTILDKDIGGVLIDGYLKYALSVIVGRALPDVRDGLKPSQRRVLYAMVRLNLFPSAKTRKCAKICGDTSGDYHPHGESIIYPTLVRLAQSWTMRYPLVIGQGNFGSIDGDAPAAMRYTEAKLSHCATVLVEDLDKETVEFISNYDETKMEPKVFPAEFPNVLCNGSSGIAVGMATNIPPHNIAELYEATVLLLKNPDAGHDEILACVLGPDFPTGGHIYGRQGIRDLYITGAGKIVIRGDIEYDDKDEIIRVTSIPYGITKAKIVTQIAHCVRDKIITDIVDIRDESDKDGLCLSIAIKKGVDYNAVIHQLYQKTDLHVSEGFSLLVIHKGRPVRMSLKEILFAWLNHRRDVITKRTRFELKNFELRKEILVAFLKVLNDMDVTIDIIRNSTDKADARVRLMVRFDLSERQANAILDMRLHSITSLETKKVQEEFIGVCEKIALCREILSDKSKVDSIILERFNNIVRFTKHIQVNRLTKIKESELDGWDIESSISNIDTFVTVSNKGYIKRMSVEEFREQKRGGLGVKSFESKQEDFIKHVHCCKLLDTLLIFTSFGRCFSVKTWKIQEMGRRTLGKHISAILGEHIDVNESVSAILPIGTFNEGDLVTFCSAKGIIKCTALSSFSNVRKTGIIAVKILEEDRLVSVDIVREGQDIMLLSHKGMGIRFGMSSVRAMGRVSRGVRGMLLKPGDHVVSCNVVDDHDSLLLCCSNGYGKRSKVSKFRITNRGGVGVRAIITNVRNGFLVKAINTSKVGSVLLAVSNGNTVIIPVHDMRDIGRTTQGIRLINLPDNESVVAVGEVNDLAIYTE